MVSAEAAPPGSLASDIEFFRIISCSSELLVFIPAIRALLGQGVNGRSSSKLEAKSADLPSSSGQARLKEAAAVPSSLCAKSHFPLCEIWSLGELRKTRQDGERLRWGLPVILKIFETCMDFLTIRMMPLGGTEASGSWILQFRDQSLEVSTPKRLVMHKSYFVSSSMNQESADRCSTITLKTQGKLVKK
ncbi:hypothetical protein BGZ60DRAFT_511782 [Tricladium varicosporioides]|nr:hypothetical protein BGZ60DRAFT_511782 [Hymenoscyphus varicosporioides]